MKTLILIFVLLVTTCLYSTIINVPADQPTIQAGIDVAVYGDTVLVQPDTYIENIDYNGKLITVASLFLTTQDTTYISSTIIDADSTGSVVTFENSENSTAVFTGFTITNGFADFGGGIYCYESSPSLQNVTITDNSASIWGGGIFCYDNSSPILQNVTITGNSAIINGGGIFCQSSNPSLFNVTISGNFANSGGGINCDWSSSPSLVNVTITGNSATSGGGIYCYESSPILSNVTIMNNTATWFGGGICCFENSSSSLDNLIITGNSAGFGGGIYCSENSSPSLVNVTISNNSVVGQGGGICCLENSSPSLLNVTIIGNTSVNEGGGICCNNNSSPILQNVSISDNSSLCAGGGISCTWYTSPSLVNVTISGNSADLVGGGIYCAESSPNLQNVTITGNSATSGGGIYCAESGPVLINSILWNDSPQEIYLSNYGDPNNITISYSDIQGGEAGIVTNNNGTVNWLEGNIDEDPLFVGTGEDPYSLLEDSPCIDAGIPDTTGLNLPPWDIIGNLRIWDGDGNGSAIIDMGAYEYGSPPYVDVEDNVIVQTPEVFLQQNYPNPFNPETTIRFTTENTEKNTELIIYNIKGQKVKTLINETLPAGDHSIIWDGNDTNDKRVGSGIYFYMLKAGEFKIVRKMILIK